MKKPSKRSLQSGDDFDTAISDRDDIDTIVYKAALGMHPAKGKLMDDSLARATGHDLVWRELAKLIPAPPEARAPKANAGQLATRNLERQNASANSRQFSDEWAAKGVDAQKTQRALRRLIAYQRGYVDANGDGGMCVNAGLKRLREYLAGYERGERDRKTAMREAAAKVGDVALAARTLGGSAPSSTKAAQLASLLDGNPEALEQLIESRLDQESSGPMQPAEVELRNRYATQFVDIVNEIAGKRPSLWRDKPNEMLSALRAIVMGCRRLREGRGFRHWREYKAYEIEGSELSVGRRTGKTKSGVRHDYLDTEDSEQKTIEATDRYVRRVAKNVESAKRAFGEKKRTNRR